jgi:hypothetical protein
MTMPRSPVTSVCRALACRLVFRLNFSNRTDANHPALPPVRLDRRHHRLGKRTPLQIADLPERPFFAMAAKAQAGSYRRLIAQHHRGDFQND